MFAIPKLPKQLTSPFGLLGDDAKLAFRSQPGGILKLAQTRVRRICRCTDLPSLKPPQHISEKDEYWEQYIVLFDSASDVFSLVTTHDLRRAVLEAPENVATLVRVVSARLFRLVEDHAFPSTPTVVGFATSIINTGMPAQHKTKEVLNCLRVLGRALPVVFEAELTDFEANLLWKPEFAETEHTPQEDSSQFVIEDEDEDEHQGERPQPPHSPAAAPKATKPSLAERLFSCAVDLMFCCGFTLPVKIQVDHHKINYIIWERGVGSAADVGSTRELDANKAEVLRFLLIMLSKQIYFSPSTVLQQQSRYAICFVQSTPRRHVLTVLCSLLNTAMNSAHPGFQLPYNHLVWKGEDSRVILIGLSLQVLCVALDYQSADARDQAAPNGDTVGPTPRTNAFRYFIAKLHRPADFAFILDGILGILEQQMGTMVNLLPGSRKPVPHLLETLMFLWKMLELNKKFKSYILESDRMVDVLAYLLSFSLALKDKPQNHGLCRALSYIIQTLSAEPAFGSKLALPVKVQIPTKWQTIGNTADFMITSIYSIVATTSGALTSLYPALIIALSNCAPHLQQLSVPASTRLIQLFTAFSNPSFLLADEGHPRLLFFMLETFNGVISHHPSENANLLYAILRSHKTFEDLGTFTLAAGLREIRRIQQAKDEQQALGQQPKRGTGPPRESVDAGHEKSRLLQNHSATQSDQSLDQTADLVAQPESPGLELELQPIRMSDVTGVAEVDPRAAGEDAEDSAPPEDEHPANATVKSEKARGKMRERSESTDTTSSLDRIAAAGVGRNGFVPTQEWVTSWQQGLPLDTVMLTISELLPQLQERQAKPSGPNIGPSLEFLRSVSLDHILGAVPPQNPRKFVWSDASLVWLTSLIWGEIYVRGTAPLGIWNSTNVRLFYVKHTQSTYRPLTDTVSTVVGGLGGLLGRSAGGNTLQTARMRPPM